MTTTPWSWCGLLISVCFPVGCLAGADPVGTAMVVWAFDAESEIEISVSCVASCACTTACSREAWGVCICWVSTLVLPNKHANKHANKQANKQTIKQIHTHTHTQTHTREDLLACSLRFVADSAMRTKLWMC